MMAYGGGCGGGNCGQQLFQQPCGFGGCGGNNIGCGVSGGCGGMQQGIAYGIPDPIRTESGRIIRAPFLPPAAVAPTPIQQANLINYGK
ncbi:unnamed protein product [Nippostrongylus brasiliensis]|uniref:Chorion class high-cysteine HCB protein 12-like n=1 Tax=Nippostrongylus brasiliensis TaxID=27835 RepID=A0A0N4YXY6_NIPBR|nr:unnamed protein product [Nippostrongylus brasiliensis]